MSYKKPFHRNYRKMKPDTNSEYSDWAYIVDKEYSKNPVHYIRAFSIIQSDLIKLFEFIEPSDINLTTYSFRIHELLMRTCIEIEANFKAILQENIYSPVYKKGEKQGQLRPESKWNIDDFKIVNKTHHLDNYNVELPFWTGKKGKIQPFENWALGQPLTWYEAYNKSKHNRLNSFQKANFSHLLEAFTGLFVLLSSQFGRESFSTYEKSLNVSVDSYFSSDFGIGGFLMVTFPDNWRDDEIYDFDWDKLKKENNRFEKIDYNNI